ncbi:MAG: ABC transporter substrate-binding protein, partial [Actinobacteria bacterium]|nr:ABC transporter substrate-binding protein [Actinomycetota bacterium]
VDIARDGGSPPALTSEEIIAADPDVIFVAHRPCCDTPTRVVAKRAGWKQITAVRTGAIYELDPLLVTRWGPRMVEVMATVAAALVDLKR